MRATQARSSVQVGPILEAPRGEAARCGDHLTALVVSSRVRPHHLGEPVAGPSRGCICVQQGLVRQRPDQVRHDVRAEVLGCVAAALLAAFLPLARHVDSIVSVSVTAAVLACLIGYEVRHFADARREIRAVDHQRQDER